MTLRTAVKTGNWSDPTVWDSNPVLPGAGDTAECAGYTVTIDQSVTVTQIQSSSTGYFAVTSAYNITAAILSNTGHSGGAVVRCSHSTGTVAMIGAVTAGPSRGVDIAGAGTVTIEGAVVIGGSGSAAHGVYHNHASAIVTVIGTVTGGSGASARGVYNNSTGTLNVNGNVIGGSASGAYGAYNATTGTMAISGTSTGGSNSTSAHGSYNNSTGTLSVAGACIGGTNAGACGLYGANSGGTTTYKIASLGGTLGSATGGYVKLAVDATVNYIRTIRSDTGANYDLSNDYPAITVVKSGTVYKLGTLAGTYGEMKTHGGMTGGMRG